MNNTKKEQRSYYRKFVKTKFLESNKIINVS